MKVKSGGFGIVVSRSTKAPSFTLTLLKGDVVLEAGRKFNQCSRAPVAFGYVRDLGAEVYGSKLSSTIKREGSLALARLQ